MRFAPAALLALAVAAAVAAGGGGVGPRAAADVTEGGPLVAFAWDGGPVLHRVDPLSLGPISPGLDLGDLAISATARSPDGRRIALASADGARVTWADLRTLRRLGTIGVGRRGHVSGVAWPSPRRIVFAVTGARVELVVVDPEARRVVRRNALPGFVLRAEHRPGGLVLLTAPADATGLAALAVAGPDGVRTVTLPVEAGVDPPRIAEPGLAVSHDGRRAVVVPGGARVLEVDLRTLAVAEHELAEPVSLLGRVRAWLEPVAHAKGPLEGAVRQAAWVGDHHLVVAGHDNRQLDERSSAAEAAGVRLIDTRDWSVRTLAEDASSAAVAGTTVLAYGGSYGPGGVRGDGLRAFGPDGRERFRLFGDRFVTAVTAAGRHAYVVEPADATTRIDVVDLASGRLLRTVRRPLYLELLGAG